MYYLLFNEVVVEIKIKQCTDIIPDREHVISDKSILEAFLKKYVKNYDIISDFDIEIKEELASIVVNLNSNHLPENINKTFKKCSLFRGTIDAIVMKFLVQFSGYRFIDFLKLDADELTKLFSLELIMYTPEQKEEVFKLFSEVFDKDKTNTVFEEILKEFVGFDSKESLEKQAAEAEELGKQLEGFK